MGVCVTPLVSIPGSNFNTVDVPASTNGGYKSYAEKLLYEIWQTLLLIQAANPPTVTKIISFDVGDGQANTPANGTNSIELPAINGQSIVNSNLLVIREGIGLKYSSAVTVKDIRRYNHGGNGGFVFEGGLTFQNGEHYDIFIVGYNTTDQV
jgi:hypothetical protein